MIKSSRNQFKNMKFSLSDQPIARTSHHKFLGDLIDNKLSSTSTLTFCSKVSQSIGGMRRISHLVPVDVLRFMYFTLIYSRLTCATTEWRSAFNSISRRLESLISRAISLTTDQSNTNQLEFNLQFIQFKGAYDYFLLCRMLRIIWERKHEHFTQKNDNQIFAHNH